MISNIEAERARAGMTIQEFTESLGIERKTYYNWRAKGEAPAKMLVAIADVLGCTVSDLTGSTETADGITDEESNLVTAYRKLSDSDRLAVRRFVEFLTFQNMNGDRSDGRTNEADPGGEEVT